MIKVNPEKAKAAIMDLIEEIPSLMNVEETSNKYREWCSYLESTLITIYGNWKEEPTVKAIYRILHPVFSPSSPYPIDPKVMYQDKLNNIKAKLEGLYNSLLMFSGTDNNEESNNIDKEVDFLANILKNFHRCALQLRDRQNNQAAFIIKNEYDVQDLLHAILLLKYDDVRNEEPVPSRSGAGSRIDFLLKKEQIGIEVKMTRKSLGDKEICEQILTDIDRYSSHPNCKKLIFFIYDPYSYIKKPTAMISDLESKNKNITVIMSPLF